MTEHSHQEALLANAHYTDQAARAKGTRPVLFLAAEHNFDDEFVAQLRLFRFEPEFVTEIPVETNASVIVLPLDSDLDLEQAQLLSESHHIPLFISWT